MLDPIPAYRAMNMGNAISSSYAVGVRLQRISGELARARHALAELAPVMPDAVRAVASDARLQALAAAAAETHDLGDRLLDAAVVAWDVHALELAGWPSGAEV